MRVYPIRLSRYEGMEEEFDIKSRVLQEALTDGGKQTDEMYSRDRAEYLLSLLSDRQREYAQLLIEGYSYDEIKEKLGVSSVAVWMMMQRIRKRLSKHFDQEREDNRRLRWDEKVGRGACLIYFLLHPRVEALDLHECWREHKVLRDYVRPDLITLSLWLGEFRAHLNQQVRP